MKIYQEEKNDVMKVRTIPNWISESQVGIPDYCNFCFMLSLLPSQLEIAACGACEEE